jgi:hypothetical protein
MATIMPQNTGQHLTNTLQWTLPICWEVDKILSDFAIIATELERPSRLLAGI